MIDYGTFRLMHQHSDGWKNMEPLGPLDSAADDSEREILRHGVTYQCSACDRRVVVTPPDDDVVG